MLFDPAGHEPLTARSWSEAAARDAIAEIAADAEASFDERALWAEHPADVDEEPHPTTLSLHLGASGAIWALDELDRLGLTEPRRSWAPVAAGLHERYLAAPDFESETGGAVRMWPRSRERTSGEWSGAAVLTPPRLTA